jgi:predicted  nucleic acid-binding Zn-ribbon protein
LPKFLKLCDFQEEGRKSIAKFQECRQTKTRIDNCREDYEALVKEMEHYCSLPPDIDEAQKKLDDLRKRLHKITIDFRRTIAPSPSSQADLM